MTHLIIALACVAGFALTLVWLVFPYLTDLPYSNRNFALFIILGSLYTAAIINVIVSFR